MPDVKKYKITEPYLNFRCVLGEAPFWEKSRNNLRFVDIVKKKVHFINLDQGPSSHRQLDLDFSVGTTADIEGNDNEFIFGGKLGYGIMKRETGESRWIQRMWSDDERQDDGGGKPGVGKCKEERMRSNDGAVDAMGRYFVGAMNDPELVGSNITDEGTLFRLDPDLSLHRIKHNVTIPNGISWSLDNKTIYFTDSPSGKIRSYPYNLATGSINWDDGKDFFTCPIEGGVLDGHCQDEEGCFWVACYGTSKVFRVDPKGEVVSEIECPTKTVTCPGLCATELFITSAADEDAEYAGALFRIDVGVKGAPLNKFKLKAKA